MKKQTHTIQRSQHKTVFRTLLWISIAAVLVTFSNLSVTRAESDLSEWGEILSGSQYLSVSSNDTFSLFVNPQNGDFYVENLADHQKWYAYPPERSSDSLATGFNQSNMESALIVSYINDKKVTNDTNSSISSVAKQGLKTYRMENGVIFEYHFPDEAFTIPISCTLNEDGIEVSILTEQIKEQGELKIVECVLFPYFGSAAPQDNGYCVLPDGSGVLVPFTAGEMPSQQLVYKKSVYGRDPMLTLRSDVTQTQNILLPVFGIKKESSAVLGIITSGDAISDIELYTKGSRSSQTAVHPVMVYRKTDTTVLNEQQWNERIMTVSTQNPARIERYTVKYILLGSTDYSGMAKAAADYYKSLRPEQIQRDTGSMLQLNIFCSIKKPDSFLGFPVDRLEIITNFRQIQEMLDLLSKNGLSGANVTAYGAFSGGMYDKMPVNAKLEGKLGGKKDWQELSQWGKENGMSVYPAADLMAVYCSGNGVSYKNDASRSINGGVMELHNYQRSTYKPNMEGLQYTILSANHFEKVMQSFAKSVLKQKIEGFMDIGAEHLSSDNHRDVFGKKVAIDRENAKDMYRQQIISLTESGIRYMAKAANGYLLPYTSNISDVPSQSSRERGFGSDIPFYQLVASELAQLSSSAVNFTADPEQSILKAMEYGMAPAFFLSYEDTEALHDSNANWMYCGAFEQYQNQIADVCREYGEILEIISQTPLVSHNRITNDIIVTEYASGAKVYINYSDKAVVQDGVEIPPNGAAAVQNS